MSLEAKIELLTAAVEALTRAMQPPIVAREPSFMDQVSVVTGEYVRDKAVQQLINEREKEIVATDIDASKVTEVRIADSAVTEIVPNESSTPKSGAQSEPEQTKSFTYDDVKRATNALSAAKGKEVTIAALAHFGVTRATQLTEAQWGEYIVYCEKAAA